MSILSVFLQAILPKQNFKMPEFFNKNQFWHSVKSLYPPYGRHSSIPNIDFLAWTSLLSPCTRIVSCIYVTFLRMTLLTYYAIWFLLMEKLDTSNIITHILVYTFSSASIDFSTQYSSISPKMNVKYRKSWI